jgi:signal transduction histidine kinase
LHLQTELVMERTDFEQWKAKEVARLLALVETERRYYQEMVAMLPAAVVVLAPDESILYANRAFRQTFGVRSEELRRKTIRQILPSEELAGRIYEAQTAEHAPPPVLLTREGRSFRIDIVAMRNWDDENEVETLLLIGELAGAPEIPSEAKLAPSHLPAAFWQASAENLAFQTVGGAVAELLGYPQEHWLNTPGFFEERIYLEDREATMALYRQAIANEETASAEFRSVRTTGEPVWCRETIRTAGGAVSGVVIDIGRRRWLEGQRLTAARMEALQGLAARMAHDLNNPLMIASGYGEEILNALPPGSTVRNDAAEMLIAIRRISQIANHLNEFGRRHANPPGRIDLAKLITSIEAQIRKAADVPVELMADAPPVWASGDSEQLAGVILTLASNALESAQDRTRLTVGWSAEVIQERIGGGPLEPGKYAKITLRDDGRGFEARKLQTLFEQVLPEKDAAGFALSPAYIIVREWGGNISVEAEPHGGTAFSVYLPWIEPEPAVAPPPAPAVAEAPPPPPVPEPEVLRETILVVEDEAGIRGLVRKILRRERYQVLEAGSAEEALTIAVSHGGPIHLLLTDVVLPGLRGPDLARRMYEASPSLKVLYISGYTDDESVRTGEYPPGARFLAKPFTLSALVKTVRETLDS